MRFIRTWIEKPLSIGAVTPSGARLPAPWPATSIPRRPGPIIELGPGTGPVTEALVAQGIDPSRLVLVEFNPTFCRLLRARYPAATVVQGDAYSLKRLLAGLLQQPAAGGGVGPAAVHQAAADAPAPAVRGVRTDVARRAVRSVHLHAVAPIPKRLDRVRAEASERIWMNIPPARVWVYRRD